MCVRSVELLVSPYLLSEINMFLFNTSERMPGKCYHSIPLFQQDKTVSTLHLIQVIVCIHVNVNINDYIVYTRDCKYI